MHKLNHQEDIATNRLQDKEAGFSLIEILLIVIIIALIVFLGWFVYHSKQTADKTLTSATAATSAIKNGPKTSPTTSAVNPYAGWKTYTLPVEKLSLQYPSDWTVANTAPTATQDDTILTASDGFTVNIADGESNGGDAILEAPTTTAVPVTFAGQADYLVFLYGRGSTGQGSSDGMIASAVLQTSTNEQGGPNGEYPWPTDKYAVGPNDTTGAVNAMYMLIGCGFKSQLTLQQASNNADFKTAQLIIKSMHY